MIDPPGAETARGESNGEFQGLCQGETTREPTRAVLENATGFEAHDEESLADDAVVLAAFMNVTGQPPTDSGALRTRYTQAIHLRDRQVGVVFSEGVQNTVLAVNLNVGDKRTWSDQGPKERKQVARALA